MRVGIIALLHESNTFIQQRTHLQHFRENLLVTGERVRDLLANSHHELGGMFAELADANLQAVPILAARAIPFGPVTSDTFEYLLKTMFEQLDHVGPLDGILVAPHGATVSDDHSDADGYWLRELRTSVGKEIPIIGTLDPHANLSPQMVSSTDALIAYRTNPHLDQHQRGREAATLMARTLRGEIRPAQAATFPPLAINIERQNTNEPQCRRIYDHADDMLQRSGVLSNSILLGFPYADVREMGSAALVVCNDDHQKARQLADELGHLMWQSRSEFLGQLIDVANAVMKCQTLRGPVCLLDMGDNVGGGSPGDGTVLAHELRRQNIAPSFICLNDPQVVEQAATAGVGAHLPLQLGGRSGAQHGPPFEDHFQVVSIHDGVFEEPEPRHGGFTRFDQGKTVVITSNSKLTFLVTSRRTPPFSLNQLTAFGLNPKAFRVLVAKGVNAPIAAYAAVCPDILRANSPGVTCADMTQLHFARRRRPMFPFEQDFDWMP